MTKWVITASVLWVIGMLLTAASLYSLNLSANAVMWIGYTVSYFSLAIFFGAAYILFKIERLGQLELKQTGPDELTLEN